MRRWQKEGLRRGFKEVRVGDKGEWLSEGRVEEEMGRGGE